MDKIIILNILIKRLKLIYLSFKIYYFNTRISFISAISDLSIKRFNTKRDIFFSITF